jgi:hypothetical protein
MITNDICVILESISSGCNSIDEQIHAIFVYALHEHEDRKLFLSLLTELKKVKYDAP